MVRTVGITLAAVVIATVGQLFLRSGMQKIGYIDAQRLGKPVALVTQVVKTPQVVVGLTLFVISAAAWLIVLSRVPISLAYPFVGLTYVLIPLISRFVLGETVPAARWGGVALIVAGIVVVGLTTARVPG